MWSKIINSAGSGKSYCLLMLALLPLVGFNARAQQLADSNGEGVKIDLKITDQASKTSGHYKLIGTSYSVMKPSNTEETGSCTLILELGQDADALLLKWIAGSINEVQGEITVADVSGTKKTRKINFNNAQVASASESFYIPGGSNSWPQLSVYINTLTVDGTPVFPGAKIQKSK